MRRKPSPRLAGILTACDPTSERSSDPAAGRSSPTTTRPLPNQSAGGVHNRTEGSRDLRPGTALGPHAIGKTPVYAGRQRSPPAHKTHRSHGRPRTAKQHEAGFESHLTAAAGQRPLPTRQASPRTGLTLPPRWCHRRQARAIFTLTGHAPDVPSASVDSGHSRTTRVGARSLRAVGSLHTKRSEGASQARGISLLLVRTRSARHQEPLVPRGHERSCSDSADHRSQALHRHDLGRPEQHWIGFEPLSLPPPWRAVASEDEPRRPRRVMRRRPSCQPPPTATSSTCRSATSAALPAPAKTTTSSYSRNPTAADACRSSSDTRPPSRSPSASWATALMLDRSGPT
jgi:hypothetical protein